MVDDTPFFPGLSPVAGKAVVPRFDGGRLSSDGGLLALREVEAGRAAGRVPDGPAGAGAGAAQPDRDCRLPQADDRGRLRALSRYCGLRRDRHENLVNTRV
jgi:hypothetical protein